MAAHPMTVFERAQSELSELSKQLPSLAELARDPRKLALFVAEYQRWYTRAVRLVSLLGRDRLSEFEGYYLADTKRRSVDDSTFSIQDYILNVQPSPPSRLDVHRAVVLRLTAQVSILQSLEGRIDGVLSDIIGEILAEFETLELDAARKLLKTSPRAASALSTVVLENHLVRVARFHGLKIPAARPTVRSLSDLLRDAGVCDESTWRKTRSVSDQQQEYLKDRAADPDAATVGTLISELDKILKAVG